MTGTGKHVVCYVLGEPGVGKTTLVREFVCSEHTLLNPKPKWTLNGRYCAAGHYTGEPFDGGDTVPYTGAREALVYWYACLRPGTDVTFLDGDRFSTKPTLAYLHEVPNTVILGVHLVSELAGVRRLARGTIQNSTWVKGRITKANNFAKTIGAYTVTADHAPGLLALAVANLIDLARAS